MCLVLEQVNSKTVSFLLVAACLVGMVVGSGLTLAVLNVQRTIPSSGLVVAVNVGVFSDSACTLNVTMIDWGTVYPGESVSRLVYVENGGNVPLTLSMNATGWNPFGASGQIGVSWDREGFALMAGQSIAASLTLVVSPGISGVTNFSVNVVITGSG